MSHHRKNRRGLTLIELVVVLVVLVAVGGIVVPKLPSMLTRTSVAVAPSNVREVAKTIEQYQIINQGGGPNGYDSLIDQNSGPYDLLPRDSGGNVAGGQIQSGPISGVNPEIVVSLAKAGITSVWDMDNTKTEQPTIDPYGAEESIGPATELAFINPAAVTGILGNGARDPAEWGYLVFGVGNNCDIIRESAFEAPVHFNDAADQGANLVYCRYGAIYRVPLINTGGQPATAQFVGMVAIEADGLRRADQSVDEFWNVQAPAPGR